MADGGGGEHLRLSSPKIQIPPSSPQPPPLRLPLRAAGPAVLVLGAAPPPRGRAAPAPPRGLLPVGGPIAAAAGRPRPCASPWHWLLGALRPRPFWSWRPRGWACRLPSAVVRLSGVCCAPPPGAMRACWVAVLLFHPPLVRAVVARVSSREARPRLLRFSAIHSHPGCPAVDPGPRRAARLRRPAMWALCSSTAPPSLVARVHPSPRSPAGWGRSACPDALV